MSELTSRMSTTPLAAPTLALSAGIACGRFVPPFWPALACVLLVIAAALYLCLPSLIRDKQHKFSLLYRQRNALWLIAIPACTLLGILLIRTTDTEDMEPSFRPYATGVVTESAATTDGDRLTVSVDAFISDMGHKQSARPFKILVYTGASDARPGDSIMFRANLLPVSGNATDANHADRLYARGIDYTSSTPASLIKVTAHDNSLRFKALEWRDRTVALIESTPLQPDTKAFLSAFLTGDKDALSPLTRSRFAASGIAHILALSGLHAGIILLILGWILIPLDLLPGARNLRFLLMAAGILLFALFTGLGASVVRAAVMAVCLLGARILQRPESSINSLCLAACIILACDPRALFDVGFQLSFFCTLTILSLLRTIPFNRDNRRRSKLLTAIAIPCAIFLTTWPVTAYHFHNTPLLFLPLNLLLLPLLPLFMTASLLYIVLSSLSIAPSWSTNLLDRAYSLIDSATGVIASIDSAQVSLHPHWLIPVSAIIAALCLFYWLATRTRMAFSLSLSAMLATLATAILLPVNTPADNIYIPTLYDRTELRLTRHGETQSHTMRPGSASLLHISGTTILYLDTRLPSGPETPSLKADILIADKNCDSNPDSVLRHISPERLILSPSLYPRQTDCWSQAAEYRRTQIHDLATAPFAQPL